jgi:methyl-accepting chemotaxis protein
MIKKKEARRMTIGTKFLLIGAASLVPLGFTLALWLVEIDSRVVQVDSERVGLVLHGTLKRVLAGMVAHRDAAVLWRMGDSGAQAALTRAAGEVQLALEEATAQAAATAWGKEVAAGLSDTAVAWDIVKRSVENRPPEETWLEHNELLSLNVMPRFSQVGRLSGLYVDPDPASYYLVRIVIERLPTLTVRLGELRSLLPMIDKRNAPGIVEIDKLQVGGALAQSDVDAIDSDVKNLALIDPDLMATLKGAFGLLDQAANGFLRTVETSVRSARANRPEWASARETTAPVDRALEAYDRGHQAIAGQLHDRRSSLVTQRNLLLAVALSVVGAASLLGFFLMRSVTRAIGGALQVADRVASGDLTQVVEVRGTDETARLMQALQSMNQALARMVGEVRSVADSVASEARQLSGGNRDLSERTESQASAIEEAASSMEELTASVRQNMDSARETLKLTGKASDATTRGMEAATRVVDHMESIRQGTKRVGEIVGMIDSIAFQTNILALNAAVEAARAGEHGRGFAVVAQEVRSLAKRCASSAREIKGLVASSSEQVTDGQKLVDEVAESIGDINARVAEVDGLMNGIVAASVEQSSGIEQVGQTITQMERVTQQNAAMVEEILAATEALTRQTSRLAGVVGAFRLTDSAREPVAAQAQDGAAVAVEKTAAPRPVASRPAAKRLPQR